MAESKRRTFVYKLAKLMGCSDSLEDLLVRADLQTKAVDARLQKFSDDDGPVRYINSCYPGKLLVAGSVIEHTPNRHQPVIELDPGEPEWRISLLAPQDRQSFVEGMLYFGVAGNHVLMVQSRSVTAFHLENHLQWLLRDHYGLMPRDAMLTLIDRAPEKVRANARAMKSVRLRAPLDGTGHATEDGTVAEPVRVSLSRAIRNVLLGGELASERTDLAELLGDESVEVLLEVRKKGRRGESNGKMLDAFAAALSHSDVPYIIGLDGGGSITSREVRVKAAKLVPVSDGLHALSEVARIMEDLLMELRNSGQISDLQ